MSRKLYTMVTRQKALESVPGVLLKT